MYESKRTGKNFTKYHTLHISDAYMLGGEDISTRYITQRHKSIKKFCDALWKPTPYDYVYVRPKKIHMFDPHLDKKLRISQRRVKSMSNLYAIIKNRFERVNEADVEPLYFGFNSILFLRSTVYPWTRHVSQKNNFTCVFHPIKTGQGIRNVDRVLLRCVLNKAFEGRIVWNCPQDNTLNMNTLIQMRRKSQPSKT